MSTKILSTSEIGAGLVNGSNKVFTTLNPITSISSLLVNGVPYAQYQFIDNIISLDDAPSSGIVLVTYSYESNHDYLDNSGWIVGEVMTGAGKKYNSFYPISLVDEVRVAGIPVTGYSIIGNSILLATSTTTGQVVEIDYFRKDLSINSFDSNDYLTKKQVRDLVYVEISQEDSSARYPNSLVDKGVSEGVVELVTQMPDKTRYVTFSIDGGGLVHLIPKDSSIVQFDAITTKVIPPKGRLISSVNGDKMEYSNISSTNVVSMVSYERNILVQESFYVGYKLPRNIRRVVSVGSIGDITQDAGSIQDFLSGVSSYYINNGYIYLNRNTRYTIEVELNDGINSDDDNSIIYVHKDDIGVIVYYCLRQLYASRENDKLQITSQLYLDKLKSYKKRIRMNKSPGTNNVMKTSNRLMGTSNSKGTDFRIVPQNVFLPAKSIDGGYANN